MTGYGIGRYVDLEETIQQFLPQRQIYHPDPVGHAVYEELFSIFRNAYEALCPSFSALAAFSKQQKGLK